MGASNEVSGDPNGHFEQKILKFGPLAAEIAPHLCQNTPILSYLSDLRNSPKQGYFDIV